MATNTTKRILYIEDDTVTRMLVRRILESQGYTVLEAEDGLRGRYGIPWGESIKGEFTREVGKIISRLTGKPVNFKAPELLVTISPYSDGRKVSVKASPIFIEGRYRKLVAGIPQSRWLCSRCRGEGCPECNWTGRRYQESVEEIIEGPLLEQAEAGRWQPGQAVISPKWALLTFTATINPAIKEIPEIEAILRSEA